MFEWLNNIDTQFFLSINGKHTSFFDCFFTFFTAKETWYPLYILLLVVVFRKYKLKGLWVSLFLILSIVLSDQISVLIKELVCRLRPSQEPALANIINIPTGKHGLYGFVSSHAANSFALALMVGFISKSKRLWVTMLLWALLVGYSRIYVGVHYPFDVIAGGILGGLIALGVYYLLIFFDNHFQRKKIQLAGSWESAFSMVLVVAVIFISVTLLVVSLLMVK